jgi:hypothetical protein
MPSAAAGLLAERSERRRNLLLRGMALSDSLPLVTKSRGYKHADAVRKTLNELAEKAGMSMDTLQTFRVRGPRSAKYRKALAMGAEAIHILSKDDTPAGSPGRSMAYLFAKEEEGRIVSYKELHSK